MWVCKVEEQVYDEIFHSFHHLHDFHDYLSPDYLLLGMQVGGEVAEGN
jgi:hypothetical protein